jgi:hypothetical protein
MEFKGVLTAFAAACISLLAAPTAEADVLAGGIDPWRLCGDAIAREERASAIPRHLLSAIAHAESGRKHPRIGRRMPWPWSVMAEGQGRYLPSKAAAIQEVRELQARGVRNIDVGCMQINLHYHPSAFSSLDEAFSPGSNVAYAAQYLRTLFAEKGSWPEAAGRYHSATPEHKIPYQERVMAMWRQQQRGTAEDGADDGEQLAQVPDAPERAAPLRQRQPNPKMLADLRREARALMVRRGKDESRVSYAQPGLVRLPPRVTLNARNATDDARFANRRQEYMQAWRESRDAGRAVTVVRGSAQRVYSFDMQ